MDDTYNIRVELAVLDGITNFIFLSLNFLLIISSLLSTPSMSFSLVPHIIFAEMLHSLLYLLRVFLSE